MLYTGRKVVEGELVMSNTDKSIVVLSDVVLVLILGEEP